MTMMTSLLVVSLASFCCVFLMCLLIKRSEHLHASLTHDHDLEGIQKFHHAPVPRVGGVAIMAGLLLSFLAMATLVDPIGIDRTQWGLLLFSALPIFLGGLIEDLTKQVSVSIRLLLSFVSAGIAAALLGAVVHTINIPAIDALMAWSPVAIAFTIFAVGGVTHSFNLIDGYNGLAGGVTLIVMTAVASTAYVLGDQTVLMLSLFVAMATLGFLVWNWPRGEIFLGDGGAYLLGFLSAVILLMFLNRNPSVSAWFALALVGYPVFETLYSMFRRKVYHNVSHDAPDDQHMHQLLYKCIKRVRGSDQGALISNNSLTSVPIWLSVSFSAYFTVCFYNDTQALMWFVLGGMLVYKLTYRMLLRLSQQGAAGD
jgi:UDP-GlcNAc:undecaprenyl-phosphate/decaprenyl-phosphate GlcNAc-1-phosphate transferase